MEILIKIVQDSRLLMDNLENGEDINVVVDNFKELKCFNIDLLISFYEGKTDFLEEEYFELMNFLDYLDSERLDECIIFAKHFFPDFCKNKEYRELIRYCEEFEIEQTLFLSFCRYDILDRVEEYMTEENKNSGYNFSLMVNSLNSINFLKEKGAVKYKDLTNSIIKEVVKIWFEDKKKCEIRFGPIEYWNTSKITSMSYLFLQRIDFNSDLSRWNVSNVTNMNGMFSGAINFNCDLSNWNVSNVTTMYCMFCGATSFNSDLSNWNVANVTNMVFMFSGATNFNSDISKWNVNNVITMNGMFYKATLFNSDLSRWNVSNVMDMRYMFKNATSFNSDISNWNIGNTTNVKGMFFKTYSMNENYKPPKF